MKQKDEFLAKLKEIYFGEDLKLCEKAFEIEKRKTCFRINTLKSDESEIFEVLGKQGLKAKKIVFLKNGYFLENGKEKDLWDLNIFKDGKIYLQSLSSQIPVDFLGLEFGDKILDITASPGGKTSQAQSLLNNSGEIKAIDNNQIRIDKLKFTLERQGIKNVEIIKTDARSLLEKRKDFVEYFDKIIADLPCSAEGKFNFKKEKSFGYWKQEIVNKNAKLQKDILKNIVPMLKKGGELIYSTCTISPEENEDIVHFLLCNYDLEILKLDFDYKFARNGLKNFGKKIFKKEISESVRRILPSEESEGFFIAKFRKK
ncbi:RsmB/NOP family class I SAM-dependent RNA methyltransferase [Candidatus Gracilibacteria bacterium]|nr:MAG: RsmB/NOP family class I SAM-dependent RNA methyltransferase [Candidatus Gracilibacteria bacterium]